MKNRVRLLFLVTILMMLIGCNGANEELILPSQKAKIQSETILQSVLNEDAESIKALLSQVIVNTHDLDREIEDFFNFIEGDIVSYDAPVGTFSGSSSTEGEITERVLNGWIENIKTNTGGIIG